MKRGLLSIFVLASVLLGESEVLAKEEFFTVDIYISSADEDVNAFGTTLNLPSSWNVDEMILKDSDLIYWIENPTKTIRKEISFSGIFLGGVQNLKNYSTPLLLFSLTVNGDFGQVEELLFSDSQIFLNHPMALEAQRSEFLYRIRTTDEAEPLSDLSALDGLIYSFTKDPVTGEDRLVINSYRGALAAYSFEMKEGDWMGVWTKINGVTSLNGQASTVSLFATSPNGEQTTILLRSSLARFGIIGAGILLSTVLVVYLCFLSLRVLRFDPLNRRPKR